MKLLKQVTYFLIEYQVNLYIRYASDAWGLHKENQGYEMLSDKDCKPLEEAYEQFLKEVV